jgi:hypothetical protein
MTGEGEKKIIGDRGIFSPALTARIYRGGEREIYFLLKDLPQKKHL